ncbi:MAG TPA: hypothetical protein VKG45_10820 [Actinomycetes bacterium]|nr:hypothetical protein [Actinomycetes bacterium]
MSNGIPDSMRDPATPDDVEVTDQARAPVEDPTLGIAVALDPDAPAPVNRLVAIGDSLTHGFQSGAVFNTDLSYPAIVAYELGWYDRFRRPVYGGRGGLPLNVEFLLRELERRFGDKLDWWELPLALFHARQFMDEVEDYWERGPGSRPPAVTGINHALGIYGWDLRDALDRTWASCAARLGQPKDDVVKQVVENDGMRAAMYVLPSTPESARSLSVLGAAKALGEQGADGDPGADGIETLVVMLGSNNALGSVTELRVAWSADGYDDVARKGGFTVWRPTHFAAELAKVAAKVRQIRARHVIWGTVPHVTIAPLARGVGAKVQPGSRYFPYYTRPWVDDRRFNARQDPCITAAQARAVDSAIDQYNQAIVEVVRAARGAGRDWYVLDIAGLLDRVAARRYLDDPLARPPWWTPYELPAVLRRLSPVPDSRFLQAGPHGRGSGGLFSLDGVHPTTIGYGILAQELINVMRLAGVTFRLGDGRTERTGLVTVDFERLLRRDSLVNAPPRFLGTGLGVLGWADENLDVVKRTLPFGS